MVKIWIWTLVLAVIGLAIFLSGVFVGNQTTLGTTLSAVGITIIIISALIKLAVRMKKPKA